MKGKYNASTELCHDEVLAKINKQTGEIQEITKRPNNIPEGKEVFEPNMTFKKTYDESWTWLRKNTTNAGLIVTMGLIQIAKANTNSLEPLNGETSVRDLEELLGVSKSHIKKVLAKLWDLGVYGKFEVKNKDIKYTNYWILNPYLAFSGKLISSDIARLFDGTPLALGVKEMIENKKIK